MPMGKPRKEKTKVNPKKEPRKKDTLISEEVKEKPSAKIIKKGITDLLVEQTAKITEEEIMSLPVMQTLNASVQEVSGKLQDYETEIKETNEKVSALAEAVGALNDEFSKFMQALQSKFSSLETPPGNNPPGTSIVSTKRVDVNGSPTLEVPPESSKQDKLLEWANILSQLMGAGASKPSTESGGGVNAGDMIKLVLELQNNAEERALKRQEVSIKNIVELGKLFTSKKIEPSPHYSP